MSKNILVIDDDKSLRDSLMQTLSAAGFYVASIDRSALGMRKLLAENYDLVFIDINMPEISGPNLCRALRKHEKTRKLPVVLVTATYYSPEQLAEARQDYGVDDFLLKPFTGVDLQRVLERFFVAERKVTVAAAKTLPIGEDTVPMQLHRLYVEKSTGLLHLHHQNAKKIIYIKEGYPIFARSNLLSECLGRMLVKEGVLTQEQCDLSVARTRKSGRLQGTELIEMGLLTPEDLNGALVRQVTDKLLSTFAWRTGTLQFESAKAFKKEVMQIRMSPANLIMQGVNRYWSLSQLDTFLFPFNDEYLQQATDPHYRFQDIELKKRGNAVFNACQGKKSLEQILEQYPLTRREVQRVIAALLLSEMLEHHNAPQEGRGFDHDDSGVIMVDEQLRRKIFDDYRRVMDADYFSALRVSRESSATDVRRAYYRLAKVYHPDRFLGSGLSQEMSTKINDMFQYISQAYTVLSDPHARADYLDELLHGPKKKVDINRVIEAEAAYQEGYALLRVKRYVAAVGLLKKAVELSSTEPEYMTSYAWALFKSNAVNRDIQNQAIEIFLSSLEINPTSDLAHLYLGYVYQAQNRDKQAEKSFEMAVQANPRCTDALRELRLINLRREEPQSMGLFSGFKKKG